MKTVVSLLFVGPRLLNHSRNTRGCQTDSLRVVESLSFNVLPEVIVVGGTTVSMFPLISDNPLPHTEFGPQTVKTETLEFVRCTK